MWNSFFSINSLPIYYTTLTLFQNGPFQPQMKRIGMEAQINNSALQTEKEHKQGPQSQGIEVKAKSVNPKTKKNKKLSPKQKFKRKCERQDYFQRKKQKKDRNLPSIIFKYFFQYLMTVISLQQFSKTAIPSQIHVSKEQFLSKLRLVIPKNKAYISLSFIKSLCCQANLSNDEKLIFKILLKRFLTFEGRIIIATRKTFKKTQKISYLKVCRQLLCQVKGIKEDG